MSKMFVLLPFFTLWTYSLAAQERTDSIYTFYFIPQENVFYMSYDTNQKELKRLLALAEQYREAFADNSILIYVDGYCYSLPTVRDNLALAKLRSNRVKSELITLRGLKESNFVTHNHTKPGNSDAHTEKEERVIVRVRIPVSQVATFLEPPVSLDLPVSAEVPISAEVPMISDAPAKPHAPAATAVCPLLQPLRPSVCPPCKDTPPRFALKTNLLYAAALLINAEAEYYLRKRLSLNLDWQYAWWSRRSRHKYYRLAAISPELRYWFASHENFHGHFGGFYVGTGLYEFMARPTHGIQGEFFIAGGLTYGYMFRIGRKLRMELSIGVGYMMTEYRQYHWDRGCYVYEKTQRYSYFGPTKAKVSLVWPLNRFKRKPRIDI